MTEKKRQCGTCRFFLDPEKKGHGKCGHPLRAGVDSDLIMYRANELGCRTRWGTNFWQDVNDLSDPTAPETPQQPTLPEPVSASFDDEVTSVSIAGRSGTRSSVDDDVIDAGTTGRTTYYNDGLQDERRELLSRSSHDALAAARKRHTEKIARQRELIPFADDDAPSEAPNADAPIATPIEPDQAEPVASAVQAEEATSFPPDDFVEEEHPTLREDDNDDVLDEGIAPGTRRSPRMRKLMSNRPKDREAMMFDPARGIQVESNNPENRGQWNSVPQMNPGIELPFKVDGVAPELPATPRMTPSAAPTFSTTTRQSPSRSVSFARDVMNEERRRADVERRGITPPLRSTDSAEREPRGNVVANTVQTEAHNESPVERPRRFDRNKGAEPTRPRTDRMEEATPRQRDTAPTDRVVEAKSSLLRGFTPVRDEEPQPRYSTREAEAAPIESEFFRDEPLQAIQRVETDPPAVRQRQPARSSSRDESWLVQDDSFPLLDMAVDIAPQVPRACGTCASFREDGTSGCGSCINRFANPEQRIVEADGLACLSTIGTWWIPADEEVWLDEFHVNTSPTPRMDLLLEHLAKRRRVERTPTPVLPDIEEFA